MKKRKLSIPPFPCPSNIGFITQESKILPDYLCSLSKDEGVECEAGDDLGSEAAARYHFDPDAGMCRKFAYRGCQGNRNR